MAEITIHQALEMGLAFQRQGDLPGAESVYRQVLAQAPNQPDALHLLGMIAQQVGRCTEALELFERAIAADGRIPEYHHDAAVALESMGRGGEAAEALGRALAIKPDHAQSLRSLAHVLMQLARLDEAETAARQAIAAEPNSAPAYDALGNILVRLGRTREALAAYRQALDIDPALTSACSNLLLALHYDMDLSPEEMRREHERRVDACVGGVQRIEHSRTHKELRVGFLSPDFREHSVACFIAPILRSVSSLETYCYSDVRRPDAVTGQLRSLVRVWRDTAWMSDEELARQISADEIDVLVDLAGHTAGGRLRTLAMKPAPVQASYLGYPDTIGLPVVDFRITDHHADPPGAERWHTEKLARFSGCCWRYEPPVDAPPVSRAPVQANGHITFGCLNAMPKLSDESVRMFADVLKAVPGSRLMLKALGLIAPSAITRTRKRFASAGIDPVRLDLLGPIAGRGDHLSAYARIDIALDTFPYHGTATTCEALWMGVPVITRAGEVHVSRVGLSLLKAVGLDDLIAQDEAGFVRRAAALAGSAGSLIDLRRTLRGRMRDSELMGRADDAARLSELFQDMFRGRV